MLMLDVKDVHKHFGQLHVLKGISLQLERGETGVLFGRSGSGKSTLLRCINYLESIDSGEIHVDNELVTPDRAKLRKLRANIGFVFQHFNLFPHLSILGNVTLGLKVVKKTPEDEAREIALKALEDVGLKEKAENYPEELSGGQQQRVAIARSIAMNPKMILFDEPTSALDPELIGEVLEVMKDLSQQGMTMLVVSHEMGFARETADKMFFLHNGKLVEEGPPSEIFRKPKTEECRRFIEAIL
jgi:ABC-type polar amino acid transport system ATPase subunit